MRSPIMSPGSKATMRARAVPDTPDCKYVIAAPSDPMSSACSGVNIHLTNKSHHARARAPCEPLPACLTASICGSWSELAG